MLKSDEVDLIDEVLDMKKKNIENEKLQIDLVDVQELYNFLHLNYGRDEMKHLRKLCRLIAFDFPLFHSALWKLFFAYEPNKERVSKQNDARESWKFDVLNS